MANAAWVTFGLVLLGLGCGAASTQPPDATGMATAAEGSGDDAGDSGSTTRPAAETIDAETLDDGGPATGTSDDPGDGDADSGPDSDGGDDATTGWTPPADCGGGALADLAAEIEPGAFIELTAAGLDAALVDAGGGHHILQYSDKGVWDPNTCQALFTGGGHLSLTKFVAYSASENTWFRAPDPSWWCETTADDPYACSTHAYGHNALNPTTGEYWFRRFNSQEVYRTQVASPIESTWTNTPNLDAGAGSCIATALEYFPELGGLVYVNCSDQSVDVLYDGEQSWSTLPGNYEMGPYHNYAVYSAAQSAVLFGAGNGSTGLHLLGDDGSATTIAPPPRSFHPSPGDPSTFRILTADPISGRFLAYAPAGDLYEYDADTDAWSELAIDAPVDLQIAIPVSTYGVIAFVSAEPRMFVYRHVAP